MRNLFETIVGAIVLLTAVIFFVFSYNTSGVTSSFNSYDITAKFNNADGISSGSDVRIGGVKIGSVARMNLDPTNYLAIVHMQITSNIAIPKDSNASIVSDGFMGGKYISITPGGDTQNLSAHEEIKFTQSSINFETLIGKYMFGGEKK